MASPAILTGGLPPFYIFSVFSISLFLLSIFHSPVSPSLSRTLCVGFFPRAVVPYPFRPTLPLLSLPPACIRRTCADVLHTGDREICTILCDNERRPTWTTTPSSSSPLPLPPPPLSSATSLRFFIDVALSRVYPFLRNSCVRAVRRAGCEAAKRERASERASGDARAERKIIQVRT